MEKSMVDLKLLPPVDLKVVYYIIIKQVISTSDLFLVIRDN